MPTLEVRIRPIKVGFIVSHSSMPDKPTTVPYTSDFTEEFCQDAKSINDLLVQLTKRVTEKTVEESDKNVQGTGKKDKRPWNTVVTGPSVLDHNVLDGTTNCEGYFH